MGIFGNRSKGSAKGSARRNPLMERMSRMRRGRKTAQPGEGEKPEGPEAAKVRARKAASVNGKTAGPMAKPRTSTKPPRPQTSTSTTSTSKGKGQMAPRRNTDGQTATSRDNTGPQEAAQSNMDRMNAMKAKMSAAGLTPPPRQMSSATSQQAMANLQAGMGAKPAGPRPPMSQTGSRQAMPPEPMMRRPMGPNGSRPPMPTPGGMRPPMMSRMAGAAGPMMSRMAKGGKAKVSEYGGKEMYTSKAAMMKHEGEESMSTERKEGGMGKKAKMKVRGTGAAKKGNKFNR